jgi:cobalt-zinc-cadmium resistance protein CzcA
MIMGLTWLPVASALFLKPTKTKKRNISDWIMDISYRSYLPSIKWACNHKSIVLGAALVSLIFTGILFSRMGGEFVPTLDEGDFVIQPVLKTGTSLSKTVEMTTKMENILIKGFPDEVHQIVSRIGAAEVPTDPMSMEEIDMIIKLKPKDGWTSAKTKEELADNFKEALSVIPGVEYEFTQPIEMRFNELITGVRSDIAIKIFGEDLDYINKKALEIKNMIADVPGASDIILEKTTGLPQIRVNYKRDKIAYYGVNINTLNTYLAAAFGGKIAGVVFEGEKRFDMSMRFGNANRTDIDNIRQLQVPVSSGARVPFNELADIEYTKGPAKISRDNTHRRIVVSINVRNRDLQSVIEDIQQKIDKNIKLAPGNYIEYGGQFENLQNATKRLLLAVPVALLLIFIFLHFAFGSLKDAIMIFTAIPLATVGGVLLLWVRGMPFSVSAGVGFVALFGIAVLNGIVLIEHLKELQHAGMTNMRELIMTGTKNRLRPVMLTAGAAAMGFLPMAISTGAGAEVQRPLATVVIGGLFTSTLLTMIALPLLFEMFYNIKSIRLFPFRIVRSKTCILILAMMIPAVSAHSQGNKLQLDDAIGIALQNNRELAAYTLKVEESKMLKKTAFAPGKTNFTYGTDQNNIAENGHPLSVFGIEQNIGFPTLYSAESKSKQIEIAIAETKLDIQKNEVAKNVANTFFTIQMLVNKRNVSAMLDSLFTQLLAVSEKREEKGDIGRLEVLNIKAKKNQLAIDLDAMDIEIENAYKKLKVLMNHDSDFELAVYAEPLPAVYFTPDSLPVFKLLKLENDYYNSLIQISKNKTLPDFSLNYFLGSNRFENSKYYHGFQVGVGIPLFFGSDRGRTQAAKISSDSQNLLSQNEMDMIKNRLNDLTNRQMNYKALLDYYNLSGKILYDEIMRTALKSYQLGEINFYQFVNSYETAVQIQVEYFENIYAYNIATSEIKYFSK